MNPFIKKLMYITLGCAIVGAGVFFAYDTLQPSTNEQANNGSESDVAVNGGINDVLTSTETSPTTVVDIKDLLLKQAINVSLDRPSDADITIADMQSLTSLSCMNCGVSDLSGLEHATNLVNVDLHENYITDLTPLANLTKLESICLGDNRISDLSALANLENLASLEVSYNQVADLSPVSKLTNLQTMMATNNKIEDISVLATLNNLKTLDLSQNNVQNIEALATIDTLERANLQQNPVEDVTSVMHLYGTDTHAVIKGEADEHHDMEDPDMMVDPETTEPEMEEDNTDDMTDPNPEMNEENEEADTTDLNNLNLMDEENK